MILTIDIGNSATCIGLFNVGTIHPSANGLPLPTNPQRISNKELGGIKSWLPKEKVKAVMVASVVPEKNEVFSRVVKGLYDVVPRFIDSSLIKGAYPELGADRIANLIGGRELFGLPLCVIDFGSATTIDVLKQSTVNSQQSTVDGEYGGGIILPGVEMGLRVLHQDTSLLPEISQEKREPRMSLLGKSTIECIKSGSYWGELCRIQGLMEKIKCRGSFPPRRDFAGSTQTVLTKFVCTGGAGELFAKSLGVKYEPWLTLLGLYFIWEKETE